MYIACIFWFSLEIVYNVNCVYLYIRLLSLLSLLWSSTLVNTTGCYKGELPEDFFYPSQYEEGIFYVSIHQLSNPLGGGGRKERQYGIV